MTQIEPARPVEDPGSNGAPVPPAAGDPTENPADRLDGFPDIVAYIEGTTAAIWDRKNPGLIARWYTPTTVVHTSDGDTYGRDAVIANSIQKMAAFPDIRDHVEETIWARLPGGGYRTSMRWTWTARHTGFGHYGPPTGRQVVTRGIAECIVRDGRIVEEWVAYDELSTLRQLGLSVADRIAAAGSAAVPDAAGPAAGEVDRLPGQDFPEPLARASAPDGDADGIDFRLRHAQHEIWNRRMLGVVEELYAPNAVVHGPDGRELTGPGDVRQEVLALLAMLPDARQHTDELYANTVGPDDHKVALRWTLVGTHTGPSRYGPPTGRRVRILGLSQLRLTGGRVVEEWTVWSEFHLMKQLAVRPGPEEAT